MPLNHRKRWTKKELNDLLKETTKKIAIKKIAENHKRTIEAIKFKLIKYAVELIEEEPSTSLKHISKITNLSKEDLLEGFKKIKYNYYDDEEDYEVMCLLGRMSLFWLVIFLILISYNLLNAILDGFTIAQ